MKKLFKIFMVIALTVLMTATSLPVNTVFADDVPETTETSNEPAGTEEETTVPGEAPADNADVTDGQPTDDGTAPAEEPADEEPVVEEEKTVEQPVYEVAEEQGDVTEAPAEEPVTVDPVEEPVVLNAEAFEREYTVGDLTVKVSYEAGTVPEGTDVVVGEAKPEALEAIKEFYGAEVAVKAADISFVWNDEEIEPKDFSENKVKVSLTYAGEEALGNTTFDTLHVAETLTEEGTVVYGVQDVQVTVRDIPKTVPKYKTESRYVRTDKVEDGTEEVPVYETKEITEERTTFETRTRQVAKTRTVRVKVAFKWWDPSTWLGYKYVIETYYVTEEYQVPVTETVVIGYEEVQVGTKTVTKYKDVDIYEDVQVEDGTEEIIVGQEVVFETGEFSTYAMVEVEKDALLDDADVTVLNVSKLAAKAVSNEDTTITASKTLDDNLDENGQPNGTKKLSLSVKGSAQSDTVTNVTKSNVVIMIDLSGSMNSGITNQYVDYKYDDSTYIEGQRYYGTVNGSRVRVYRYNNNWIYQSGRDWYQYVESNGVEWRLENRLNATKAAAYALIDALLKNNTADVTDIMEISVAKFADKTEVTDYWGNLEENGTETIVSKSTNAATLKSAIRDMQYGGGTNWEAAYQECLAEANRIHVAGENTSVIFLTDGRPTLYGEDSGSGQEGDTNVQTCWNAADEDARAIVTAGYDLYNIFAYGQGSGYLKAMTNYAYRGTGSYNTTGDFEYTDGTTTADHFFDAQSTDALIEAFEAIIDKINKKVGFAGVGFEDGVTLGVTNTSVVVDGTVHEDSFHYEVKDKDNKVIYTVQFKDGKATFTVGENTYEDTTPETVVTKIDENDQSTWITSQVYSVTIGEGDDAVTYKMSPATINKDTGLIDWDLAGLGILEDGWTYTLSFDLWPNQFAYDMMADLNNGVTTLEEVEATVKDGQGEAVWNQIADALVVTFNGTSKKVSELTAEEKELIDSGTVKCTYAIYTNWKQEVTYYTADQEVAEDGTSTIVYSEKKTHNPTQPDPVALTSSTMSLRKIWAADLDSSQVQKLLYNKDGSSKKHKIELKVWKADTKDALDALVEADGDNYYKKVTLGWDEAANAYDWDTTLDVAPGNMIDETLFNEMGLDPANYNTVTFNGTKYYVLESGHYYTVTEVTHDYHFDLVTIVYHPMLVNGKLSNVTFKEDGTVETIDPMSTVDATNTLRGGINLKKVVLATDGTEYPTDDEFSFTIVFQNDKGLFVGDDIPWYGVNGMYYHDAEGNYIPSSATGDQDGDGLDDDGNIPVVTNDGKTATYTLKISSADSVRINNVPLGTTYTITETQLEGFDLDSVVTEAGVDVPQIDEETGEYILDDEGNIVTVREVEFTETTHELVTTGEIVADAENNITYKNKMKSDPVFYVYHSSSNTVEKISAFDSRVTRTVDEETKLMKLTFNIAKETLANNLYGGYYKSYKGAEVTDDQITGKAESGNLEYVADTAGVATAYDETHTGGLWASDTSTNKYDYAYIKAQSRNVWGNDYYTVKGTEMNPEADTVYYLKEVPNQYDLPYTHYTYNKSDKLLRNMWYITAVDDLKYTEVGFIITTTNEEGKTAEVAQSVTIQNTTGGATVTLTPKSVFGGSTYKLVQDGYLGYWDAKALIVADTTSVFTPYWKTVDGVIVRGTKTRTVAFNNGKVGTGGMRVTNAATAADKMLADIATGE